LKGAIYWIQIGAENGDPDAQSGLAASMESLGMRTEGFGVAAGDVKMNKRLDKRVKF